jgi:hypothetical protein
VETFQGWVDSLVQQAADRDANYIRTIENHWKLRLITGGFYPTYAIQEFGEDSELPDEVHWHPVIARLEELAAIFVCYDNVGCFDLPYTVVVSAT